MRSSENHRRAEEKLAEEISEQLQLFLRTHAGQVRQGKQDAQFIQMRVGQGNNGECKIKLRNPMFPPNNPPSN